MAHARLGPSSSDIWLACLGAPAEWAKNPPRMVGFPAREGTLAHALCEASLRNLKHKVPWAAGQTFDIEGTPVTVTDEMLHSVATFAQVTSILSDLSHWRLIESEVSIGWMWDGAPPERVFGTLDFAACDGVTLYIIDFKYGRGKFVKVDANTQLLMYALGALARLRIERPDLADTIETVCLVIVQPRAGGDPVRQWAINVGDLIYWGFSTLKPAIDKIVSGKDLALAPGNHCYFCAASLNCPAYQALRTQRSIDSFPVWVDEEGA